MFNELINCIELLQEKFEGEQVAKGFNQYIQLVDFVADNYDDSLTRAELLNQHPWLEPMTEAEQYNLLKQARRIRRKAKTDRPTETPLDRKIRLEQAIQAELGRRTEIEKQAVRAMSLCDFETADYLLGLLDDEFLHGLLDDFAKASKTVDGK